MDGIPFTSNHGTDLIRYPNPIGSNAVGFTTKDNLLLNIHTLGSLATADDILANVHVTNAISVELRH